MQDQAHACPAIHLERITARTVEQICELSETLTPQQRKMVADNADSIAAAHFSEMAWMRAIYAGDTPVGFLLLHIGSDYADGIGCPGVFLWRFMIAGPFQRQGYGRQAMQVLFEHLRALGVPELYTSYGLGEASPEGFYRKLGFVPTGGKYGDEVEAICRINSCAQGPGESR